MNPKIDELIRLLKDYSIPFMLPELDCLREAVRERINLEESRYVNMKGTL